MPGLGGIVGGFGGSAVGGATVMLLLDDAQFKSALASDEAKFKSSTTSMGAGATKLGSVAKAGFNRMALGAGIAVAAGVNMAVTFQKTFAQIGVLAGKLGMPMDQAKAHVLDLAKATGQDPNGLASALYFAASAGLQASQVMPVLDASAKAAAMGMGDAQTVAQTLTSVLNAYKGTGLDTAGVMNIMTAAVKNGKAEMSDFATGLGPIISVAAAAGVSFQDMAAALAEATNQGVPFARAVTGLRFLISSLESPTAKAASALQSIGLSASDVATMLKQPGGLEKTIQLIHDRTLTMGDAGRQAWSAITGGARGAIVAVDLVGKHTADTNRIVADLGRSAQKGATDFSAAWSKISQTDAVKFQQALASIKVALVDLGTKALPLIAPLVMEIGKVATAVIPLAPAFLAVYAAIKTVALGGALLELVANPLGAIAVSIGLVIVGMKQLEADSKVNSASMATWAQAIAGGTAKIKDYHAWVNAMVATLPGFAQETARLTFSTKNLAVMIDYYKGKQIQADAATQSGVEHAGRATAAANALAGGTSNLTGALGGATGATKGLSASTAALTAAHKKATQAAIDELNAESQLAGGYLAVQSAASTVAGDQANLNKLRAQGKTGTEAYRTAVVGAINDEIALTGAVQKYQASVGGAAGATNAVNQALSAYGHSLGLTNSQIRGLVSSTDAEIARADALAAKLNAFNGKTFTANVVVAYHTQGTPVTPGKQLP